MSCWWEMCGLQRVFSPPTVQNEIGPRRRSVFVRDGQAPALTIDYICYYYYYLFIYIDYSRPTGDRDSVVQNNTLHSNTMHFKLFVLVCSRYSRYSR